jgi:DNA-binding NtrC family response regulator
MRINMTATEAKILVVDDEPNICRSCVKTLGKVGYHVDFALNGPSAVAKMEDADYDLVITDLKMNLMGGMEVLHRIKEQWPDTAVIVITGYSTVSSAVEVMKMGAFDYVPKPFTPAELRAVVTQALDAREMRLMNHRLKTIRNRTRTVSHQLIGSSPKINKVIQMIDKVAPTDSTVLIHGQSGTGKELVARAVHANSKRADRVFFAVDCGTLSGSLLSSELFGHKKGAFTGAHADKAGIFTRADRGTVFLDEISNIDLDVQGQLLRFLESREFLPLGSTTTRKVDIRLILATNKNLEDMVADGLFREDFYYRIFVYPILLPPLNERKKDILPIAYHFMNRFSGSMGKKIAGFDNEVARRLTEFEWPGNVRQLRNVIERAVILHEKGPISLKDLPVLGEQSDIDQLMEHVPETNAELKALKKEIRQKAVRKVEKNFLLKALTQTDWNVTRAAEKVGLQRSNFQNLMRKYDLKRPHQSNNAHNG